MHGRGTWQGGVHGGGACVAGGVWWGHVWWGGMHSKYYEIRSMSGWYTSYWNAFLFCKYFQNVRAYLHQAKEKKIKVQKRINDKHFALFVPPLDVNGRYQELKRLMEF